MMMIYDNNYSYIWTLQSGLWRQINADQLEIAKGGIYILFTINSNCK